MCYNKNYYKLYFHENKKFSWLPLSLLLFLVLADASDSLVLFLPCFPYDV